MLTAYGSMLRNRVTMKWVSPVRDKAVSTQTEITDSTDGNNFVHGSRYSAIVASKECL
jgi:hypothetical protein